MRDCFKPKHSRLTNCLETLPVDKFKISDNFYIYYNAVKRNLLRNVFSISMLIFFSKLYNMFSRTFRIVEHRTFEKQLQRKQYRY